MLVPWKKQAKDHPDRIWFRSSNMEITYGSMAKRILLYRDFIAKSFPKGSKIGLWKLDKIPTIFLVFCNIRV